MRYSPARHHRSQPRRSRFVGVTVAALFSAWLLGAAGDASAGTGFPVRFTLQIGTTLNTGSGVALGTNPGLYTGSRDILLTQTPTADPDRATLRFDSGIEPIPPVSAALDPTVFRYTVEQMPVLTFDRAAAQIGFASDTPLVLRMDRVQDGSVVASDTYTIPLTTGSTLLPSCGFILERTLTGTLVDNNANDRMIDEVKLVGGICIEIFDQTQNFDTPLEFQLIGSLEDDVECPDPDDGVFCTVDSCDPITLEITNIPDDSFCGDQNMCNGVEVCDAVLDCQPGTPVDPDDGIACTVDSCDAITGTIINAPDDTLCSDGDLCTGIETCSASLGCQAGTPIPFDDGVACTNDICNPNTGAFVNVADDSLCSDGDVCNGVETCDNFLGCQGGFPIDFDDGVACTVDTCDPITGAVANVPSDSLCSDGNACNGNETCSAVLGCEAGGPPADPDDGIACTIDSCDPETGDPIHQPNDALCADANLCNGAETCDASLGCQAGTPIDVDDQVPCTNDTCDPQTGLVSHAPDDGLCADGNLCNGTETCDASLGCQAGTPIDIDDRVPCTNDTCDPQTGLVSHAPNDGLCADGNLCNGTETCDASLGCQAGTPIDIDDRVPCTNDSCDPQSGLVSHAPDDGLCADGNLCNGTETCDASLGCQAGTPVDFDDAIPCTNDSCDPQTGLAIHQPDDALCADADLCNGAEICTVGLGCQAGPPLDIDDGITCTLDSCDPASGEITHLTNDALCDDDDVCTGVEFCDAAQGCQAGTPIVIDDGIGCTLDSCDPQSGAVTHLADDARCDDGNSCNGEELCDASLDCQAGTPPVIDDGVGCTVDSCSIVAGVSNTPDDTRCSDGDLCNGVEICDPVLDCVAGTPRAVDDGIECTADACDPLTGVVTNRPVDSVCSDDNRCNGIEFCDVERGCRSEGVPALANESFNNLLNQSDTIGLFVPELDASVYRIGGSDGVVASVTAASIGEAGVANDATGGAGDRVFRVGATSSGPFVAEGLLPPDPIAGFGIDGRIADALARDNDLEHGSVCVEVRTAMPQRATTMRLVVGDEMGRFAVGTQRFEVPDRFERFELRLDPSEMKPVDGATTIDLTRVETVGIEFATLPGSQQAFAFDIDDVRLIPEPRVALAAAVSAAALAALRTSQRRRRRAGGARPGAEAHPGP